MRKWAHTFHRPKPCATLTQIPGHTLQHFWGLLIMFQKVTAFLYWRIPVWNQQTGNSKNLGVETSVWDLWWSICTVWRPSWTRHQFLHIVHSPWRSTAKAHHVLYAACHLSAGNSQLNCYTDFMITFIMI